LSTDPARLEVGRIARPHGLKGEVAVALITDRAERVAPGAELATDNGVLRVVSSRAHQDRWLVFFEGVADRTSAERLAGTVLYADALDDPDALWVHDVVGTTVVERDGTTRGKVVAVIDNPAHDLLELDTGALVPVVFVLSSADGVTTIDPPAGLFE
jgi:16S rRNA processing protein RimM